MSEIIINIDKDEQKELEELREFLRSLSAEQKLKFKGFLEGLKFVA